MNLSDREFHANDVFKVAINIGYWERIFGLFFVKRASYHNNSEFSELLWCAGN